MRVADGRRGRPREPVSSRPLRSWPLAHWHALYERLRGIFGLPIVVETTSSDDIAVPAFCVRLERLDILVAAALIERALGEAAPPAAPPIAVRA